MAKHPPAHRREILRELKAGAPPEALLSEARSIGDPGHAAAAMMAIAARLKPDAIPDAIDEATGMLQEVDRPGRMAEAWSEALAILPEGRRVDAARRRCMEAAVAAILEMPDGSWTGDAIIAVAPYLDLGHGRLMQRAMANKGFELEAAKTLIRLGNPEGLYAIIREAAPPAVAAHLLPIEEAAATALQIDSATDRQEALRVLVWKTELADELEQLATVAAAADAADRAHILTLLGAREDRLGHGDPVARFRAAHAAIEEAPEASRAKLGRKLKAAMERSGLDTDALQDYPEPEKPELVAAPEPERPSRPAPHIPIKTMEAHTLALVDSYGGGLGPAHLRAVARAAPLAHAFGLRLGLFGFPTDDLAKLVDLVERDTNVGEGGGYARTLLDAQRMSLVPMEHGLPAAWPGTPLATTPHPDEGKAAGMDGIDGPICLLVGLGKQGLPRKVLDAVALHHELTGAGISLETATAMGILADRLGRVPIA